MIFEPNQRVKRRPLIRFLKRFKEADQLYWEKGDQMLGISQLWDKTQVVFFRNFYVCFSQEVVFLSLCFMDINTDVVLLLMLELKTKSHLKIKFPIRSTQLVDCLEKQYKDYKVVCKNENTIELSKNTEIT